jgi:hypothetical protein
MPENGACEGDLSIVLSSLSLASMSWLSENLAFEMIAVIVLIAFLPGEGGWYWGVWARSTLSVRERESPF